jgi:hypothetical protein
MLNIDNIDIAKFKLGKTGRAIKLLYDKEPVKLCTSSLITPFGVKSVNKDWSAFTEYYIDCSLNQSVSETSSSTAFKNAIDTLDDVIQKLVKENITLFNNKSENANEDFVYNKILRENNNYPKLMKMQLVRDKNGNFESFIFNENKEKIKIDEKNIEEILAKRKIFKCIIECAKIWYYNGKVGSIWNINQLKFSNKLLDQNKDLSEEGSANVSNVYNNLMISDD